MSEPVSPGPSWSPQPSGPPGVIEYIFRVLTLGVVGPLRVAHGQKHEVPVPDATPVQAHINTAGKPQFVEIRIINGAPQPVFFVSDQQTANVEQSQPWNTAANEVYRAITYPSDKIFIRQQVALPTRVMVTEVTL